MQHGLFNKPTVINNVETLVNIPLILREGGTTIGGLGTQGSKGRKLFCVSGHVARPGVYEYVFGISLRQLIEQAGLKGHRIGDAQISLLHGNYIVNRGTATARDIVSLIKAVRERVLIDTDIFLETEVMLSGDWSTDGDPLDPDDTREGASRVTLKATPVTDAVRSSLGERNG